MTFLRAEPAVCTNKLCDYEGYVTLEQSEKFNEKRVCPKCGFKTLGDVFEDFLRSQFSQDEPFSKALLERLGHVHKE